MGIHFNSYNFGNSYSNYSMMQPRVDQTEEVKKQENLPVAEEKPAVSEVVKETQEITPLHRNNASIDDVTTSIGKKDNERVFSQNSSIEGLDVQKAISDMKRDQILKQYQFFVPPNDDTMNNMDGRVIAK